MLELIQRLLGRNRCADNATVSEPNLTPCAFCGRAVRLNQIVFSPYHVVGCTLCHVAPVVGAGA